MRRKRCAGTWKLKYSLPWAQACVREEEPGGKALPAFSVCIELTCLKTSLRFFC